MVNQRVSRWNSCKKDMTRLYLKLVDLGMEYRNGKVYLPDLEDPELRGLGLSSPPNKEDYQKCKSNDN